MLVFFRLLGAAVGLAVRSAAFNNVFDQHVASMGPLPPSAAMFQNSSEAIGAIPLLRSADLRPETMALILDAYTRAIRATWLIMARLGAVGFVTSLAMKALALEKEEVGRLDFELS